MLGLVNLMRMGGYREWWYDGCKMYGRLAGNKCILVKVSHRYLQFFVKIDQYFYSPHLQTETMIQLPNLVSIVSLGKYKFSKIMNF